jgi:D-methionine transport system ATP-binding protein
MEAGRVVEQGDVYDIFSTPQQPVTRRFIATALHDRPTPDVVARLHERHAGRIVTFGVRDGKGSGSYLTEQLRAHGVTGSIVYGGITDVGARPLGSLTFELTGAESDLDAFLATARERTDVVDHGRSIVADDDTRVEVAR